MNNREFLRLLIELRVVNNLLHSCSLLQALDNGDFFAREAVERIHKPVDLGLQGGIIRALSASVVRLSWFRRRCNKSILTYPEFRKRRNEVILTF